MSNAQGSAERSARPYLIGWISGLALTFFPFAIVGTQALSRLLTFVVITLCGVAQIAVHLRFFLGLSLKPRSQEYMAALALAAVIVFILIGGTVWIILDLNYRML